MSFEHTCIHEHTNKKVNFLISIWHNLRIIYIKITIEIVKNMNWNSLELRMSWKWNAEELQQSGRKILDYIR